MDGVVFESGVLKFKALIEEFELFIGVVIESS
jgi:hypothetical protein